MPCLLETEVFDLCGYVLVESLACQIVVSLHGWCLHVSSMNESFLFVLID
jgi:hypothetical protein